MAFSGLTEIGLDVPTRRLREWNQRRDTHADITNAAKSKGSLARHSAGCDGAIFEKKVASTEKRNKKSAEKQVTQATETSHDEPLVDIYSRSDETGWRILTKGFDFSCLGAQKSLLAVDNIKRLVEMIRANAPNARIDDGYLKMRGVLGRVWENEPKLASYKWQREAIGKYNFDNVTVIDNVAQFTKYSRLQRRLIEDE
jgi:hypothetical protein